MLSMQQDHLRAVFAIFSCRPLAFCEGIVAYGLTACRLDGFCVGLSL